MEELVEIQPAGERWDPLGAPNDQENDEHTSSHSHKGNHDSYDCSHW